MMFLLMLVFSVHIVFYCCPIKSIKYKKYRSAIVYSMVESYYVIPSPIKK